MLYYKAFNTIHHREEGGRYSERKKTAPANIRSKVYIHTDNHNHLFHHRAQGSGNRVYDKPGNMYVFRNQRVFQNSFYRLPDDFSVSPKP